MDLATIIGLVLGLGALFYAFTIELGGPSQVIESFAQLSAALIVFGGTIGATFVAFPMSMVLGVPKVMMKAFIHKQEHDPVSIVNLFVRLAEKARREGLLSLEEEEATLHDPFLKKGIMLVVDGQDPELIRQVLDIDIDQMRKRHTANQEVIEMMGGFAPTMGIIGTVAGLIAVLKNLGGDPSQLGSAVAVAFVATFFGIFIANIFFVPMQTKLKEQTNHEVNLRQMCVEGILAVQAGENPRTIGDKLEGFLPPKLRGKATAAEGAPAAAGAR